MCPPTKQINLMRGWPSPDVLPAGLLTAACQRALGHPAAATPTLQYGPGAGHAALRAGLAQWLGRHYGVEPGPERLCVTGGASQSLATILQRFTDPRYTRAVWLVAPCYFLACGIFHDAGFAGRLRAAPEDDEGLELEALARRIAALDERAAAAGPPLEPFKDDAGPTRKLYRHVIYAVPTCANPSGKSMSLRRREGLVRLARACDALVVCDDVYDLLQWPLDADADADADADGPETRLPRLCDIDRAMGRAPDDPRGFGHAVSNASFSKMAGPGMRTGWVEAAPAFVAGLACAGSTLSGGAPSQLCAAMLGDLVQRGELQRHVERVLRPSLQRRHRLMMDAVRQHLVPLGFHTRESSVAGGHVYGGYFIWLTAGPGLVPPAKLVAEVALEEENLVLAYGNMFEVCGDEQAASFDRELRLCFAWEPEENLVQGVQRLANVLKRLRDDWEDYEARATRRQDDQDANFVDAHK